ncbi:MAG: TetM/TetW/TetO/TetS family tetracycline resistance ribosomal protection protein [Lachnospiraceae bacterium]|nr:TetM/TetW/TetO/TetS family tetracycline resistance ribosomal protection protein [Lachnospiraceae bacterium]
MEEQCRKKNISVGLLAHVDAGKTTLAERLLYMSGSIRKLGRVDHGDTFLDNNSQERSRGITIFSKQAQLTIGEQEVTLLDTPGHVDFSAEMERALQVLDYAILVISGTDGVQGHVYTLWKLLKRHQVPTFLFINKMDLAEGREEALLAELREQLGDGIVDFSGTAFEPEGVPENSISQRASYEAEFMENVAVCDEDVLEYYLEHGCLEPSQIKKLIVERKVFPCFFGSALKGQGIERFMTCMSEYMVFPDYADAFGAKVFKISRDEQGNRLTHMKITGGSLKVKALLTGTSHYKGGESGENIWQEKINQIRIYSGAGFQPVSEAAAGQICAVTGLTRTYAGQGLGIEQADEQSTLEPVLNYQVILPPECDVYQSFLKLRELEEEDPTLHIVWQEGNGEIHIQLMGEVQIEVLRTLIWERFGLDVRFGSGSIVYKERIASCVEGVGHFEPLRHYAEVHLWMEPGEPGSGMTFATKCSEDILNRNWQRLVLTHLEERTHKGVLTGSELTDTKITLIAGRAHQKHTEGGDFRQATYRAVRHGLMYASSELLEPVYSFRLELPAENLGRAMNDIQRMYGRFDAPQTQGDMAVLTGVAPVATMQGYQMEVAAYTRGLGRVFCTLQGYEPCHNAEEVIANIGYEPEADLEHTADSVFCGHGAGFVVPWDQVYDYMHIETGVTGGMTGEAYGYSDGTSMSMSTDGSHSFTPRRMNDNIDADFIAQEEIDEIFRRTYGSNERAKKGWEGHKRKAPTPYVGQSVASKPTPKANAEEYLLVDGYNIIFAWEDLKELAGVNIDAARDRLADILCNYQGYKKCHVILVFDAYRVKNHAETVIPYHNIHIVYTKEAETADNYIARTAARMEGQYNVSVATSDALVQMIIWGKGAVRISAQGLREEIEGLSRSMNEMYVRESGSLGNTVLNHSKNNLLGS